MRTPQPAPSGPAAPGDPESQATDSADSGTANPAASHQAPGAANGSGQAANGSAGKAGTAQPANGAAQPANGAASAEPMAHTTAAQASGAARQSDAAAGGRAGLTAGRARARRSAGGPVTASLGVLRRHWLASIVIAAGLVLRVLAQMAYHPAIIYIDSLKYLYGAWPGADPVAYKIPLRLILVFGDLGTVTLVQHLLGIAIAITIYVVMLRQGAPRWLGALAIAPVLLDGYQLQAEHMIMPDVWFEAMIVAGLAVLLWNRAPRLPMIVVGSFVLGLSTGIRQAGEILIVPALLYAIALGGGWRKVAERAIAAGVSFVVAVSLYMVASAGLTGHFRVSESSNSLTYGRMASVANCATLRLTAAERPLCPVPSEQAKGPDRLDHDATSPLKLYRARFLANGGTPAQYGGLIARFNRAVETQQPLRVLSGIWHDAIKLYAIKRVTSPGDTPIWRWQFQGNFPSYLPYILVRNGKVILALPQSGTGPDGKPLPPKLEVLRPAYGGAPQVDKPIAQFLRSYQLGGGYAPGPLLLLLTLTGLAGSLLVFARRRLAGPRAHAPQRTPADSPGQAPQRTPAEPSGEAQRRTLAEPRQQASLAGLVFACVAFFTTAVAVLAISDAFEFTWRYQLPALVTLPPAGALGIAAIAAMLRRPRSPEPVQAALPAPEVAARAA